MTVASPEAADAVARLSAGEPAALVVELDERTRTATALADVKTAATTLGFSVLSVPAVETDQISSHSRLVDGLADAAATEAADGAVTERVADVLDAMSRRAPVVVIVEDLHWTDPSSLVALRSVPELLAHLPICWVVGVAPGSRRGARVVAMLRRRFQAATISCDLPTTPPVTSEPPAFLQVAAVVGVEFDVDVVARVLDRSVGSLLTAIEEASADGTIVEDGVRLRFADARFRDRLYDDLPRPVRRALHRDVAREYLRPGSEPEAVWHLTRSTGRLTEVELRVIRHAIASLAQVAPEEAAELSLQVSALFLPRDPHHSEFVTTAAKHLGNTRRVGEALALVEQPSRLGLSIHDEARMRLVAAHLHQAAGDDTEAMGHLSRALGLPGLDEELRLSLMKTRAVGHVNLGEIEDAIRLSEHIVESVRRSTDPSVKLSANLFHSQLAFSQAQVAKALELAEQAARSLEVSAARPLPAPRIPELWLATVLLSTDRSEESSELLLAGQRNAERRGFAWSVPYWHTVRAIDRYIHDELDDAVAEAETALHAADTLDVLRYVPLTRSVLAIVQADRGHLTRASEMVQDAELTPRPRTYDMWTAAAWVRLGGTWRERAGDWLAQHANVARMMTLPPRVWPDLVGPLDASHPARQLLEQIASVAGDQQVVVRAVAAARTAGAPAVRVRRSGDRSSAGWKSLTASELRVAELVVAGQTNRSIASQLQVSIHTVGTHLRHVFTKLDINTRVELTRLALQHGLTSESSGDARRRTS